MPVYHSTIVKCEVKFENFGLMNSCHLKMLSACRIKAKSVQRVYDYNQYMSLIIPPLHVSKVWIRNFLFLNNSSPSLLAFQTQLFFLSSAFKKGKIFLSTSAFFSEKPCSPLAKLRLGKCCRKSIIVAGSNTRPIEGHVTRCWAN